MTDVKDLVEALADAAPTPPVRLRQGVISAVTGTTVSLTIGGSSTVVPGIKYLSSYTPVVGDSVWLATDGRDWMVIGKLADGSGGGAALTTRVSALEVADATTNKSGLVPIVPTSVAVGSGSASVSAAGVVTMTSATTVSLNNCFPSGYRYFRIVINASSSASDVYMHARLRGSGADNTASSYYSAGFIGYQTAGTGTWAVSGYPQWYLNLMNGTGTGPQLMTMDIMTPNEAAITNVTGQARYASSTVGMGSITNAFTHYVYTAYDGITFFPASGNITGEIRVYGYR